MASPTETYVDPSIAGDSGTGTIGDPYGDLQYALNQVTRDGTNGDRFNVKAGTSEVLAAVLSYATYGTSDFDGPMIVEGYTAAAGDGGLFVIDANGGAAFPSAQGVSIINGRVHNGGSSDLITLSHDCLVQNVEIDDTTGDGIVASTSARAALVVVCNIHNIGGYGVTGSVIVRHSYFKNGTNDFTSAIRLNATNTSGSNGTAVGNIISIDGASNGIEVAGFSILVEKNSVLSSSGTGAGVLLSSVPIGTTILSNLAEGFSGAGGDGFDLNVTNRYQYIAGNNGAYNNTTDYDIQGEFMAEEADNESLGASPFDKSGSDTFANRFIYFAPVDTGNAHGGAYPSGNRWDKGAVQHADPAGGASSVLGGGNLSGGFVA